MTKFEYSTFVLGGYPTVASKYRKIKQDLDVESKKFVNKDKDTIAFLKALKTEFESMYESDELVMDDDLQETEFWVQKLAKQGAIELLSQGKVSAETMFKVSCLDNDNFVECVRQTTKISTYLNNVVQQAEKTVKPEDIVPEELMR